MSAKGMSVTTMSAAPSSAVTSSGITKALTPRRKQRNANKATSTATTTTTTNATMTTVLTHTISSPDDEELNNNDALNINSSSNNNYDIQQNNNLDNLSPASWDSSNPPFLPLEEDISLSSPTSSSSPHHHHHRQQQDLMHRLSRYYRHYYHNYVQPHLSLQQWNRYYETGKKTCIKQKNSITAKKCISITMIAIIAIIMLDAVLSDPDERLFLQPDFAMHFLEWVQYHPATGIFAFLFVIAVAVILLIPIGTPLTCGCGYIYVQAYGWTTGIVLATAVAMGGSALGAVTCFLLGRYLMREQVRQWSRKYPLFDAIDVAAAEHGLRIMAMLYLTPILPLGPVSYMCGTTSMALSAFVMAKIASLPLMLLYVFIGASTGALLLDNNNNSNTAQQQKHAGEEFKDIEDNQVLIVAGIVLSFVMIASITHYIKKELNKILDRQKKHKPGELESNDTDNNNTTIMTTGGSGITSSTAAMDAFEEAAMEMGTSITKTAPRHRRTAVE